MSAVSQGWEQAAGGAANQAARTAGPKMLGPESPVARVIRIMNNNFPRYRGLGVEWVPEFAGTLASDLDYLKQGSRAGVGGIWVGTGSLGRSDIQIEVGIRHEAAGHIDVFLEGRHPVGVAPDGTPEFSGPNAWLYHAEVYLEDAQYAHQRGYEGEAHQRLDRAGKFLDMVREYVKDPSSRPF